MNNINFDNPFLLLIGIPLLLLVIIPFIVSIRKENINFHNVFAFINHLFICVLVTLVFAKTTYEMIITETNVYVLADVSYSSHENLELIDKYIDKIENKLSDNSKLGVICFGKDYELFTELGEKRSSVAKSGVDDSATNIAPALEYAGTLFEDDVIKRIVIITDGKETNQSNIISIVESLAADDIYVDAIYLDNNISPDTNEVQLDSIDFIDSTYLGKKEALNVMVQANHDKTNSLIRLYKNNEQVALISEELSKGFNVVNFDLDTSEPGLHNYRVEVSTILDSSEYNNTLYFSQNVTETLNMLYVTANSQDEKYARDLYGEKMNLTFINVNSKNAYLPYTIEELCDYDIFVLSNINVAEDINNAAIFLESIDTLVSKFGKSLITLGNTYIQNNEDIKSEHLEALSDMLPVNYGNPDPEKKALAIVIDISRSMEQLYRFQMAKEAAKSLLDHLKDGDIVTVVAFEGEITIPQQPIEIDLDSETDMIQDIKDKIDALTIANGTYLYEGMEVAAQKIAGFEGYKREMMILSDGNPYMDGTNSNSIYQLAEKIRGNQIVISALHTGPKYDGAGNVKTGYTLLSGIVGDQSIKTNGNLYVAEDLDDVKNVMLTDIVDDFNETVIENEDFNIDIQKTKDNVMEGIDSLPVLNGIYFNVAKSSSTNVLTTEYKSNINNMTYTIPVYSYWDYGTGHVASFTSDISNFWTQNWRSGTFGELLLKNVGITAMPDERVDSPFIISYEVVGTSVNITVDAPSLNVNTNLNLTVTYPDSSITEHQMVFNSVNYETTIEAQNSGDYLLELSYTNGKVEYTDSYIYTISYLPEYDSFEIYQSSDLYTMISNNGEISLDGNLKLQNDNSYVKTYIYDFTLLFMIISISLFVIDIIVRKLKWNDIVTLFRRKRKV